MTETSRWLTASEQHAWRSFVRLQLKLVGRLAREVRSESGLSATDYGVLVHLTEVPDGRLRVLELAKALEWEKSRMSHHVDRMAKRGLVVREECPDDGRVALVVVTPAGREALADAAPCHVEAVRRLFIAPLSPDDIDTFARISNVILEQLETAPRYPPGNAPKPDSGTPSPLDGSTRTSSRQGSRRSDPDSTQS